MNYVNGSISDNTCKCELTSDNRIKERVSIKVLLAKLDTLVQEQHNMLSAIGAELYGSEPLKTAPRDDPMTFIDVINDLNERVNYNNESIKDIINAMGIN